MLKRNSPPADGAAVRAGIGIANAERHSDTTATLNAATTIAITRGGDHQLQARTLRFRPFRNAAGTVLGFFSAELSYGQLINSLELIRGPQGCALGCHVGFKTA